MAGFRGLYDKLVSYIFDTSRDEAYEPVSTDYVAVYDSEAPRNTSDTATWMPKKYVPVTTIGTGGGGGGTMSSFEAQGSGVVQVSLDGSTFEEGPLTVTNGNTLYVQAVSVPSGLTWQGTYDSGSAYALNDVVSTSVAGVYSTWWAQGVVPIGEAPPTTGTSNAYWVQLGTQGPQGVEGPANSTATTAFRTSNTSTNVLALGSTIGTNNDRGVFILMNSTAATTLTIPLGLSEDPSTGIPIKSQVSVMNINTGSVQVIGASGVTVRSADNANYLRTQYSSATLIRKATNEWYLFGDLTNIV
jgi:hypothetical protein